MPSGDVVVVKVQRELTGSRNVLVYNEDRSVMYETALPRDELNKLFGKGEFKVYVVAEIQGTVLHLGQRVPEQEW